MRLKIIRVIRLYKAIESMRLRSDLHKKFAYALIRTKAAITPIYNAVEEIEKLSPEMKAFEKSRLELIQRYAKRNDKGEIELEGENVVLADQRGYTEDLEALRARYKPHVEAFEESQAEVRKHIEEEEEVEVHAVPFEFFPETISPENLEALEPMIADAGAV